MNTYSYPPIDTNLIISLDWYHIGLALWIFLAAGVILPLLYHMVKVAIEKPCLVGVHDWLYSEKMNGPWEIHYDRSRHKYRMCSRCQYHETHQSAR